jgi:hypothetical protein
MDSSIRPAAKAYDLFQPGAEFEQPIGPDDVKTAFWDQIGALPVLGAVDHHEQLPVPDLAYQVGGISGQDR